MKRLLFLLLITQTAQGQVTGRLAKPDGSPLAGADVLLLKSPDTTLVAEVMTDSLGGYRFDAPRVGLYIVRASSLGFQAWESGPLQSPADLGTTVLHERFTQLEEAVVRAQKPPFSMNPYGVTINAESSLLTAGSSILDVLQRSPGVVLDPQHGGITLNGKSDVTVMLNGRLTHLPLDQLTQLLSSMSADNLEKIDLLTTPPANFDAGGNGGIINIVLKKTRRYGNSGSFSLSGGAGWGEKGSANVRLDHHAGKLDLNGSLSLYHDHSHSLLDAWGSEIAPPLGGFCDFVYHGDSRSISNSGTLNLGAEWQPDSKTTLGVAVMYDLSHTTSTANNWVHYDIVPDSLLFFQGQILGNSHYHNPEASVYLERIFHKGEKLTLDLDGIDYTSSSPTAVQSELVDGKGMQYADGDTTFAPVQNGYYTSLIKVGVVKGDYTRSLSRAIGLEAGFKGDYTRSISHAGILSEVNGVWVPRDGTTTDILMREYIDAGYLSLHIRFDSLASLVAGVRYESSRTRASDSVDLPIHALFPDIFLTHGPWNLSYTNRISRPSYSDLASYIAYNDPLSVSTGNPLLRPTLTHNVKLGYWKSGCGLSVLYSRDDYPIARWQVSQRPGSSLIYIQPQNLPFENTVQLEGLASLTLRSWWKLNIDVSAYWKQYRVDYVPHPFSKSFLTWSVNATSSCTLPRHWSAEFSGYFNAPGYYAVAKTYANGQLNVGVKKDLGAKGSIQLAVTDPLRLLHYQGYLGELTQDAFDSQVRTDYQPESRIFPIFRLTYRRSFGSESRREHSSLEEERSRL